MEQNSTPFCALSMARRYVIYRAPDAVRGAVLLSFARREWDPSLWCKTESLASQALSNKTRKTLNAKLAGARERRGFAPLGRESPNEMSSDSPCSNDAVCGTMMSLLHIGVLEESAVSVRIRMKKLGRSHQSFFRICAVDKRSPRDGRVLEELGTYDPRVPDTDARAILKGERIDYWLGVGAQPSVNVAVLIKKYGSKGTHLAAQKAALERIAQPKSVPDPGVPASPPKPLKKKHEGAANAEETEGTSQDMPAAQGDQAVPEGA
jgi:small subunit ribosomal protein S16